MKNIQFYKLLFTVFALGILLTSCDDFLEQESLIFLENTDPINDDRSAQAAVNGMYAGLQARSLYGSEFILANELTAGNANAAGFSVFWRELELAVIPTANFHVEDNWVGFFRVINTANTILEAVPSLTGVSDSRKNYFMGQAYFVRGLAYFDLLRQYGEFDIPGSQFGVPISSEPILSPTNLSRSSVISVYTLIESDLTNAETLLSHSSTRAYATQAAAEALLAKVYLYQGNYDEAFIYAEKVIDNTTYGLLGNYNSIYSTKLNNESILELVFSEQDQNSFNINMLTSPPEVVASQSLYNAFENNDVRRQLFAPEANGNIKCLKYGTSPNLGTANVIILRLAEMFLIRAEAHARNNGIEDAIDDINRLRVRAGATPLSAADFTNSEQVIDAILAEKRLEFAFENGSYWFDIARLGKLMEIRGVPNFRRIYPIPNREMLADVTLEQNPGYEQ
ncbi:MAG: RagB/SusD family nutrient uptake outer membrane protein [Cyclobacteriaceae bacterium]